MGKVRIHNISVSLDGFSAGEGRSLETPFGHAEARLMEWFFPTRMGSQVRGMEGGSRGVDDALSADSFVGIGAEIMGRGKFGPQTGPWTDEKWRGWWGEEPPFHTPVFVLTHHPRPTMPMGGGTTFHFIDEEPAAAVALAKEAAGDLDVRIGGGANSIRQFLAAGLVDYMHVVVVPIILGRGTPLWEGLEGIEKQFDIESTSSPSGVTHVVFRRRENAE